MSAGGPQRRRLGPVEFFASSPNDIVAAMRTHQAQRASRQSTVAPLVVGYVNPHVVTVAQEQSTVREHLAAADHVCIDGVGTSLALRWPTPLLSTPPWALPRRHEKLTRCPAHRLLDQILDTSVLWGSMLVIGIDPELVDAAASAISTRSGGALDVAGTLDGFASDDHIREFLALHHEVDLVLIGAGSPRSESIALTAAAECDHAVIFTCGAGTLKVFAGVRSHAPRWLNRLGFDWLFRFVREPATRPRYTRGLLSFAALIFGSRDPEPRPAMSPEPSLDLTIPSASSAPTSSTSTSPAPSASISPNPEHSGVST